MFAMGALQGLWDRLPLATHVLGKASVCCNTT